MDKFWIALLAGVIGGAAGALAVRFVAPGREAGPETPRAESAAASDAKEMREQIAEIRRLLDRPTAATLPAGSAPRVLPAPPPGASASGTPHAYTSEEVAQIAEKAADAALARRAEKEAADKPPPQKRAPLSEVAREIGLSASQETEIREAYREATDKFLKVMAEPESDAESLRKELTESKGDEAKQQGLMMKYMPKMIGKLPDLMVIQSTRDTRVKKALGTPENQAKFERFHVEEEDPFDLGGSVSVGVTSR